MANQDVIKKLEKAALDIKLNLLDLCHQTIMHIGGDMSIAEMMTVVWQYAINYDVSDPSWEERDRFVLSKGHAAAVTTFNQAAIGCYETEDVFKEYATNFGRFGMHSCNLINPYVEVSTGSLGHGLPVATGIATALKAKGSKSRVYVGIGDGELAEGSIWESAMLAAHYKLSNLIAFVDRNGLSFDGSTEELMGLDPVTDKWESFGWKAVVVDGHDIGQIVDAFDGIFVADDERPTVIIGNTVKGHGISFMANDPGWHAGMLSDENLQQAKDELKAEFEKKWGAD